MASASVRPTASAAPPAAKGTTILAVPVGKFGGVAQADELAARRQNVVRVKSRRPTRGMNIVSLLEVQEKGYASQRPAPPFSKNLTDVTSLRTLIRNLRYWW
jgi:hypothetical protein